jgi:hypothetical protein
MPTVYKYAPYFLFFFASVGLLAQKEVKKTVLDDHVTILQIDASQCYEVVLQTAEYQKDAIVLEGKMDGEYSQDLQMNTSIQGNTMFINTGFRPVFELPNDKLGAHKVVSISLKVMLPEGKKVQVSGTSARVIAHGNFLKLTVALSDGSCVLHHTAPETEVRTQSGSIALFASSGEIEASSKYGQVDQNPIAKGVDRYELKSVTGDIHFHKTE